MSKKFPNPVRNPLAFRLLGWILLCSSLITLMATALQLYLDFEKDVSEIEEQVTQIDESYAQSIALGVWNVDEKLTNFFLEGVLKLPGITYLEIISEGNIFSKIGVEKTEKTIFREIPLIYSSDNISINIGTLKVVASLEDAYQRLHERVFIIIGSQFIKTFIVSAFIIFIIHYMITRHLAAMADFARQLDFHRLDTKLILKRKNKNKTDELGQVVLAVNTMIDTLNKSAKEMEKRARMEGELNAAAIVQKSFIPLPLTTMKEFELASILSPAREISGDYYDFIQISDRYIALVIADVSGKGASAAMYANIARVLLREKAKIYKDPVEVLCSLNQSLKKEFHTSHFLTMSYVLLDTVEKTITYANAGHEPVVLVKSEDKNYSLLKPHGYPFSEPHSDIFDNRLEKKVYSMEKGDLVFCYTDGLTDVENEDKEMYGEEKLYQLVQRLSELPAQIIKEKIIETLQQFQGKAEQTDDITMIILKRLSGIPKGE